MSVSMQVVGFIPADEHWKKMKSAWDACKAIGVEPPLPVSVFFDYQDPGDAPGKEVPIMGKGAKKWRDVYRDGYEIDITALPEGVRFLRFFLA